MLASLYNGNVHVWNHENQTLVKSFEVCDLPVRASKFVPRKNWVITGSDDMQVRIEILNYSLFHIPNFSLKIFIVKLFFRFVFSTITLLSVWQHSKRIVIMLDVLLCIQLNHLFLRPQVTNILLKIRLVYDVIFNFTKKIINYFLR